MRARLVLVPLLFAAALLAGCTTATPSTAPTTTPPDNGVSALSADEILTKAKTALSNASSFRIKGEPTDTNGSKTTVDLQFSGQNGEGTVDSDGVKFELIKIGTDIYLKTSDDYWKTFLKPGQEAALLLLKGKYVKVDGSKTQFAGFMTMFDVNEILKPEGTVSKGEAGTINDSPTIALIDSKNSSKIYVATRGEPYPLRLETRPGTGSVDFSDFGKPADIKAPSADKVFDLGALLGG